MTCGCADKPGGDVLDRRIMRGRAAMCHACTTALRVDGLTVGCTVNGRLVVDMIANPASICPRGKHEGEDERLWWWGMRWYGAPIFIRWWLRGRLTGPIRGCGCPCVTRDAWDWVARIWKHRGVQNGDLRSGRAEAENA